MLKLKLYQQSEGYCGPTSLRMVLSYYGQEYAENYLAELCRASRKSGSDPQDLVWAARELGFQANFQEDSSLNELEKIVEIEKIPPIVDWYSTYGDHYSVVVGFKENNIIYADPLFKKLREMEKDKFLSRWFGFYHEPPLCQEDLFLRGMIVVKIKK